MPDREELFSDDLQQDEIVAAYRCFLVVDPLKGIVELIPEISYAENEKPDEIIKISLTATIHNPIEIIIAVGALKAKYAWCVSGGVIGSITKEMYIAYSDSKGKIPVGAPVSLQQRTHAFVESLKGRTSNIKGGMIGSLVACTAGRIILPGVFS